MRPCWRDLLLRRQAGLPVMTARDDDRSPIYATVRLEAIYATALRCVCFYLSLRAPPEPTTGLVTAASRRAMSRLLTVDG